MNVTLTTNGALIETDRIDMSVVLDPDLSPADALRQYADALQAQADRLARQIDAVRDPRLTPTPTGAFYDPLTHHRPPGACAPRLQRL